MAGYKSAGNTRETCEKYVDLHQQASTFTQFHFDTQTVHNTKLKYSMMVSIYDIFGHIMEDGNLARRHHCPVYGIIWKV